MSAGYGPSDAHSHFHRDSQTSPHPVQEGITSLLGPSPRPLRSSESWIDISTIQRLSTYDDDTNENTNPKIRIHRKRTATARVHSPNLPPLLLGLTSRRTSADCSSQEEYDESESESDKVLTSSNEHFPSTAGSPKDDGPETEIRGTRADHQSENGLEGDANVTVLSANPQCFTPQPNAFSHPPSSRSRHNDPVPGSYFPAPSSTSILPSAKHSGIGQHVGSPELHSAYNVISPAHRADHDAALRASLSTLLSCAAAARGLSKNATLVSSRVPRNTGRVNVSGLRIVPERVAMGEDQARSQNLTIQRPPATTTSDSTARNTPGEPKRKASRSTSKESRATKKSRQLDVGNSIAPTLLTWATAAGVVMLVGALSFSTGFVIGRETGRLEANTELRHVAANARNCGTEAARDIGLRRLRWTGVAPAG